MLAVTKEKVSQLREGFKERTLPLRSLRVIAAELNTHAFEALTKHPPKIPTWVSWSRPYLNAMRQLDTVESRYGLESGYEIVLRCLCNLQHFRGADAKRIKAELQQHLDSCPEGNRL